MFEQYSEIEYHNKNGIEYIQFKRLLELNVKHAYTLKSENINFKPNNEFEADSYNKIFSNLELDVSTKIKPIQKHTDNVKCINDLIPKEKLEGVDGLITDSKKLALVTTNADCILFLIYDPIKRVIANVHSGWRGTFQKILQKTIVKMINFYKCNPKDILCLICPSIRKCHFEVDLDVKDLCENIFRFTNKVEEFIEIGKMEDGKQKYNIDTVVINKILLKELGILEENIIDSGICSVCNNDKIYSYRSEGMGYGLSIAIISL